MAKVVHGASFNDILKEVAAKAEAERVKLAAMTPAQRAVYMAEEEKKQKECDALIAELSKDSGFMGFNVRRVE